MVKTNSPSRDSVSPTWSPLCHQIYRWWQSEKICGSRLGLGVSGGADSVAMALVFSDLQKALNLDLRILHVHHGDSPEKPIPPGNAGGLHAYRSQAQDFVVQLADRLKIPCSTVKSESFLTQEAELRSFRRKAFLQWKSEYELDWIVTAHHAQDLLETRILRLIRGTGIKGLKAIQPAQTPFLRPFLQISPRDLREDLEGRGQDWLEDPSNADSRYLRNWLRREWLPQLETRVPGGIFRMNSSLELIIEAFSRDQGVSSSAMPVFQRRESKCDDSVEELHLRDQLAQSFEYSLNRVQYLAQRDVDQRRILAQVLSHLKNEQGFEVNYSSSHIEEIRKRLDKVQKEDTFYCAGCVWEVNAEQVVLRPRKRT